MYYGSHPAPEPEELVALLEGIEDVELDLEARATTSESVRMNVELLHAIAPERAGALACNERFAERLRRQLGVDAAPLGGAVIRAALGK